MTARRSSGRCRRAASTRARIRCRRHAANSSRRPACESVSLLAEAPGWINYDLPRELVGIGLKGKYRGQTQKWFAFRFEGDESEIRINPPPGGHAAEFDRWAWKPMAELPGLIVPFKRKVYEQVVAAFRHLA